MTSATTCCRAWPELAIRPPRLLTRKPVQAASASRSLKRRSISGSSPSALTVSAWLTVSPRLDALAAAALKPSSTSRRCGPRASSDRTQNSGIATSVITPMRTSRKNRTATNTPTNSRSTSNSGIWLREELAQLVELPGALEDLTGRHRLEGAKRQVDQVVDHFAAERRVEPAAGMARDIAAQRAQEPLEHEQRDHAESQDVQGLERAVIDHLVVDGHQEQRRRQRQKVDHDRGEAELPEHRAQPAHDRVAPPALAGRLDDRLEQDHAAREIGHGLEVERAAAGNGLAQHQVIFDPCLGQPALARLPAESRNGNGIWARLKASGLKSAALKPSRSAASSRLPSVIPRSRGGAAARISAAEYGRPSCRQISSKARVRLVETGVSDGGMRPAARPFARVSSRRCRSAVSRCRACANALKPPPARTRNRGRTILNRARMTDLDPPASTWGRRLRSRITGGRVPPAPNPPARSITASRQPSGHRSKPSPHGGGL